MVHELRNWADAGASVFDDTLSVLERLQDMDDYLRELLVEYEMNKQALGELQRKAEEAKKTNQKEREQLLNQIGNDMQKLPALGDLINGGLGYGAYRKNYLDALLTMRRSLVPKLAAQSTRTVSYFALKKSRRVEG